MELIYDVKSEINKIKIYYIGKEQKMKKTDEEKIEGWNKTIQGIEKPVKIIKISKTLIKRGKGTKPYYKIYVDAICDNGCEINNTLLSNLLKKNRKVPCKCYSNKASIIGKTLADWCGEKDRKDIIQACIEDKHKFKYITKTSRMCFVCQICGEKFITTLEILFKKDDVICNKHLNRITFPQATISHYIKTIGYDSIMEYKLDNKAYDVYVPELNLIIEYDGARWHQNIENDIRKCKETLQYDNNINILRIREDGCPNFPQGLRNVDILKCSTSVSKMLVNLKEYLIHKFKLNIYNEEYSLEDYKSGIYILIKKYYKENSVFKKYPELVQALDNDNVEILKYITINTKIKLNWKCDVCKKSFKANPISIKRRLEKEGLLECDSCKLKVNNLKLWFSNQEKFTLISVVSGKKASRIRTKSGQEIIIKCNKCNDIIKNKAYKITTYYDCPMCGRNKKSLGDILSIRKDISVIGYNDKELKKIPHQSKVYVLFKCNLCSESCIEKHQARWLHRSGKIKCKKHKVKKIRVAKEGNRLVEYCPQIINEYDFNRNTRELETLTRSSGEKIYLIGRKNPITVNDYFKRQKKLGLIKNNKEFKNEF